METKSRRQIASLEVLIGGTCYGANATMYKLAFAAGFSWPQVVAGQMIFAVLCWRRQQQPGRLVGALLVGGFVVWLAMLFWTAPLFVE